MRHFLMETSVPLPRELTGEENKTPAMEFLIEKRLALEQGRLRSRGLQSGTRSQGRSNVRDPLSIFMNTIGDCALLSREEEVRLMSLVRQWQELEAAERRLEEESGERAPGTGAGQRMPAARLAEALGLTALEVTRRRWCGEEARSLMAQYNLRLVVHIAKRYVGRGVDLVDLIAEGVDGLFRAVDKFDHRRGVKFSTYSHWWVRQAMTRAITNQSRVVRLPVHVWDLAHKILRVQQSIMVRPPPSRFPFPLLLSPTPRAPCAAPFLFVLSTLPSRVTPLARRLSLPPAHATSPQTPAVGQGT